jgi:actin-related protein
MRVNPEDTALLLSDQNTNLFDREKTIEFVFEEFKHPAFFSIRKSILSLFANGRSTGLVLETGANITQVVPISEGYTLGKSVITTHVGGDTMTQNLLHHIEEKTEKPLLPQFHYKYRFNQDLSGREASPANIGHVDPSVLQFHKLRYVQEIKELHFRVSTPSEEG